MEAVGGDPGQGERTRNALYLSWRRGRLPAYLRGDPFPAAGGHKDHAESTVRYGMADVHTTRSLRTTTRSRTLPRATSDQLETTNDYLAVRTPEMDSMRD